jgi:hypothetical protein
MDNIIYSLAATEPYSGLAASVSDVTLQFCDSYSAEGTARGHLTANTSTRAAAGVGDILVAEIKATMSVDWRSYLHIATGRRYTMWLRKFPYITLIVLTSFSALTAAPGAQRSKDKDKDKDQEASQTGAQCAPGTGSSGAPAALPNADQIVRQFAQHESDFRLARDNYTYTQEVLVEDLAPNRGEYRLNSEIVFTPQGRRYEEITFAPQPSLQDFTLSPEDMKDLENIQPFVLTAEDLSKYDVQFSAQEKLDELNTYKFCVGPKRIEKNQRYFQGTVWVDGRDLAVVKTDGKAVPDIIKGDNQNLFPRFVTYRENIESTFWFPTYTRADDVLHFRQGDVHMRMTVRYKNYKRFGSTIQLGKSTEVPGTPSNSPQAQPGPNK